MAKKLQVTPGAEPQEGTADALKLLPTRIVELAYSAHIPTEEHPEPTREDIAKIAKRAPAQIGRWLKFDGVKGIEAEVLINLEQGYGLAPGTLLFPHPIELGNSATLLGVSSATAEGFEVRAIVLPEALRRAARACIELTGRSPREVCDAALELFAEHGDPGPIANPDWWLPQLRFRITKASDSGQFPSARFLLAAKPADEESDARDS